MVPSRSTRSVITGISRWGLAVAHAVPRGQVAQRELGLVSMARTESTGRMECLIRGKR